MFGINLWQLMVKKIKSKSLITKKCRLVLLTSEITNFIYLEGIKQNRALKKQELQRLRELRNQELIREQEKQNLNENNCKASINLTKDQLESQLYLMEQNMQQNMSKLLQKIVTDTKTTNNMYPILNSTSKSSVESCNLPLPSAPPNLSLFSVENETKGLIFFNF
jgi:hypothetical protein